MKIAMMIACALGLISPLSPSPSTLGEGRGEGSLSSTSPLEAQYVEVRTASVFAGPCHVNGELMTTGNDAMMAWKFDNGVRVIAAVSCDQNLLHQEAARKSEILIDSPTKAAGDAALHTILSHESATLGKVVAIRHGSIDFRHENDEFQIESASFGSMDVQGLPDHDCCKQPNDVWYQPLVHLTGRMVGYTVNAQYSSGRAGETWQREDENGAFYGVVKY